MAIIVGKNGEQKIPITDLSVSRQHCKLTEQPDGTFLLEDLGSTNGTFVNGTRVIRTVVHRDTVVTLGSLKVKVEDLVGKDYAREFEKLRAVYDQYHVDLIKLEKTDRMKNFYRSLPPTISTVVFALTLFLDGDSATVVRSVMGVITIAFILWATISAFRSNQKTPERRLALWTKFQIDYVCPQCKHFLGDIPFENLQNRRTCDYCKCQWVE